MINNFLEKKKKSKLHNLIHVAMLVKRGGTVYKLYCQTKHVDFNCKSQIR